MRCSRSGLSGLFGNGGQGAGQGQVLVRVMVSGAVLVVIWDLFGTESGCW